MRSNKELREELEALLSIPKLERDDSVQERILLLLDFLSDADKNTNNQYVTSQNQSTTETKPLTTDTHNTNDFIKPLPEYRKLTPFEFIDEKNLDPFDMFQSERQSSDQYSTPSYRSAGDNDADGSFFMPSIRSPMNDASAAAGDSGDSGGGGGGAPPAATVVFNADFSAHYIIGRFDGTSDTDNFTLSLGKDKIYASAGDDIIDGSDGVDTYIFTSAVALTANLATGIATSSATGTDILSNIENITSSSGDDVLTGDGNNNVLRGGGGSDILNGGAGNDWLYGEGGIDTLTGGSGADRFIWTYWDDVSEVDTITDFNVAEGDVIDMTDLFYEYWNLIEYNFFADDISEFFRFVDDSGGNTTLQLDLDGAGTGSTFEDLIFIQGGAGLDAQTLESSGNLMIMPASRHNDVVYDPTYDISTAKFAIDGGKIIGGSYGQINIYDIDTRNESILIENSEFTRDVEAENGLIVVSAYGVNSNAGAVYVYDLSGTLVYTLNNPNPNTNDYFGNAVDISNNYIMVGAYYNDPVDTNDGTIYIYSTADGSLLHTIDSPEAAISGSRYFGYDVAITDNYAVATVGDNDSVAGKSGTVYVYDPSTGALLYSIENPNDGDTGSEIGYNIAANDSYLLVSDHVARVGGSSGYQEGQVLLYDITDGSLLYTFSDPTPYGSDQFGQSVDLVGDYSVIAQTAAGYGDYVPAVYVYSNLDGELEAIIRQPFWSELDYSSNRMAASDTMIVIDSSYGDYYSEEAFIYQVDFLGNDLLTGTDQKDTLVGLDGDDTIYGGAEDDSIYGGRGADQLYGGSGDDWFFYDEASLDGSVDVIHDLSVLDGDVIDLRFIEFNYNANAVGMADYIRVEVSGSDLILSYNINGTGLDADYTDLAVLKDNAQYTLYDLLLYETLNVDALPVLLDGIVDPSTQERRAFGYEMDVKNGKLIVADGAFDDGDSANSGRVYVYDIDTRALLYTYDDTSSSNSLYANTSVELSDSYFAITDQYYNSYLGRVSVYNVADGSLAYTVSHPVTTTNYRFGSDVQINDTYLMVAAPLNEVNGNAQSGAVFIYDVTDGSLLYTFNNPTEEVAGLFGGSNTGYASMALTSNYAVVGSERDDTAASNSGAVYVYDLSDGSLHYSIVSPTGNSNDYYGRWVKASDDYLLISHSGDREIHVYDIDDGSLISSISFPYSSYGSPVNGMEISNDYGFFGYSLGYIIITDLTDGSFVDAVTFNHNVSGVSSFGRTIQVSDGDLVTQYSYDGQLRLLTYEFDYTNSDLYNGSAGNDLFIGLSGNDVINGNAGNDMLYGSVGDDVLYGGDGNDHLFGGVGEDDLYGGVGVDTFHITDIGNADTIHDYDIENGDVIDITELLSSYDPLTDAILDFVRLSDNGVDSVLYVDTNGETNGEEFVAVATIINGAGMDVLSLVSGGNLAIDIITSEARETYTW